MYDRWVDSQSVEVSENTLAKYRSDYRRCIQNTEFEDMDIHDINEEIIKKYLIQTTKRLGLNKRALTNLAGYIRCTFNSARINRVIQYNPFDYIELKKIYKFCNETHKSNAERIMSDQEMAKMLGAIKERKLEKDWYIPTYAVHMAILTGMRVGELSALAWTDIADDYIWLSKSEKRKRVVGNKPTIEIEKTKTGKDRMIPLTGEIRNLLREIWQVQKKYGINAEYVFEGQEGRIHATTISDCARSLSNSAGIPCKSIHCMRRTLSSNLKRINVPTPAISSMLGQTDEVNINHYTYDTSDMDYKTKMLDQVNKKVISLVDSGDILQVKEA
ncbi:MAG: tyrosine-type recombinase/integrase [Clostridiales bacterium]|nr:tyrosine-type recombinase/integrase [Clostridiales bacterium]